MEQEKDLPKFIEDILAGETGGLYKLTAVELDLNNNQPPTAGVHRPTEHPLQLLSDYDEATESSGCRPRLAIVDLNDYKIV